jgi:hypothetical protein
LLTLGLVKTVFEERKKQMWLPGSLFLKTYNIAGPLCQVNDCMHKLYSDIISPALIVAVVALVVPMAIIWPGCQVPVDQVMILQVVHALGYLEAPQQQVAQPATEEVPPERSRDEYFFEGLNILISTFCVCADGFQGLSKTFHCPIQLLTFYVLLWNY